ncbi:proton-conducting transporter transmembrane domain-containing protein [Pseudonocardia sp. TRM90224]|uniref:proton-conducting transporter transmembrane domain-containing protein n=1 Tax=Pseudonocardia sp. TRM90224 TaxID=2812678 RepID=UPI001E4F1C74|nr:proton-conducting transporter membrane subunit [Pseudonocardia sp. TRM90224]
MTPDLPALGLPATLLAVAPILVPALAAVVYALLGWRPATVWVATLSAVAVLGSAIALASQVLRDGPAFAVGGVLLLDPASTYMVVVISAVAVLAALATPTYLHAEIAAGRASTRTAARHSGLVQAFLAAMALAVLAADLGVVWVAVEATTIVTAFLVGQRRTRTAVEAAWKYVVICSAGISLALLGIVVLNFAAQHLNSPRLGGGPDAGSTAGLTWTGLEAAAAQLDPGVTRIAVVLLVVGFGTKAGLAPLHAWLPDAHSQAPAPVSALMSGVLLAVAFYAILRVKVISDIAMGPEFAATLLVLVALASLLVAASLLIAQRDYKRMLAYSSIEHMGLLALGAAVGGPAAIAAVLLHVLGHGMVKSVLFLGAGRLLQITGTSHIDKVRGLAGSQPLLAGCLGVGVLALIGLPPFSIFASELGIARAGLATGFNTGSPLLGWATAAALVIVAVIAAALIGHTSRMLLGDDHKTLVPAREGPGAAFAPIVLPRSAAAALLLGLVATAALGVTTGPLSALLGAAAHTLTGAQ